MGAWNRVVAPLVRTATNALAFWWLGDVVGIVGVVAGFVHGVSMGRARTYDWKSARGWAMFVVDNTWSLPNTALGSLFSMLNAWNKVDGTLPGNGQLYYRTRWFRRFDTTIGTVTVGTRLPRHEAVHGLQGRILGPLFYPLVIVHYIANVVLPLWWLYHDHQRKPITGFKDYFERGVYGHHWMEEWAYTVEGSRR